MAYRESIGMNNNVQQEEEEEEEEEIRRRLIGTKTTTDCDVDEENGLKEGVQSLYGSGQGGGYPWMVYLSTFLAVCGSYEFGASAGFSSPTESAIIADLGLSTYQYSWFGSILTFGAMIGAITSGFIADQMGRKGAMRVYSSFCVVGWLAIYFGQSAITLDLGRLSGGYGIGAFSYVVPVYVAEIAPVNLRGSLGSLNQLMIAAGVSVVYILGLVLSWRLLALTGVFPCAVMLLGFFFTPESPRWLAKRRSQKEFRTALQKLRGQHADISDEAAGIERYIQEIELLPKGSPVDLFRSRYRRSVIVGVVLMAFQQFGGINGFNFYAASIFESAGVSSTLGTVIYGLLQVVASGVGVTLIDKSGRKPLLLISASGMALGCVLAAVAFYLKDLDTAAPAVPILALTGILVYVTSFAVGVGPVPWVIMSEIFPFNIKGLAGSLVTLVNWSSAWAVTYTFNLLMDWSYYGTFMIFAAVNLLSIIFVVAMVPETKGKTLEQIQETQH